MLRVPTLGDKIMKIKILFVIAIVLCLCAGTRGAVSLHAADFEEISIPAGTATHKLTAAKYNAFVSALSPYANSWKETTISIAGTDIRIRWDGNGTPTASSGHLLTDGSFFGLTAFRDNANFICINKSGGVGTLTVTYDDK